MTIVVQRKAPPLPFVPPELHGKPVVSVACCYAGPVDEGEAVVRPLKAFDSPVLDLCEPKPYLANQAMFDASLPLFVGTTVVGTVAGLVTYFITLQAIREIRRLRHHHPRPAAARPDAAKPVPPREEPHR